MEAVIHQPGELESDSDRFQKIVDKIYDREKELQGIGTLGEKTIHEVVKNFYCSAAQFQEQKVGRYVADIAYSDQLIEIQNGNFNKLRGKLQAFLPEHEVTVVYPIPVVKKVYWLDPETSELSAGHKSPKKGSAYDAFPQLYRIRPFLSDPHLHFHFFLLDMDEFRLLNGWSRDRKRGSQRYDRLPGSLCEIVQIECSKDYLRFFPPTLPENFISKDLAREAHISLSLAQSCLLICKGLGVVTEAGKKGRSILYHVNE